MLITAGASAGALVGAAAGARSAALLHRYGAAGSSPRHRVGKVGIELVVAISACVGLMYLITHTAVFGADLETKIIRLVSLAVLVGCSYVVARFDFATQRTDEWSSLLLGGLATGYVAITGVPEPVLAGLRFGVKPMNLFSDHETPLMVVVAGVTLWALITGNLGRLEMHAARHNLVAGFRSWLRSLRREGLGGYSVFTAASLGVWISVAWILGPSHLNALCSGLWWAVAFYICGVTVGVVGSYIFRLPAMGQGDITYVAVVALIVGPFLTIGVCCVGGILGIVYGYGKRIWYAIKHKVHRTLPAPHERHLALLPALTIGTVFVAARPDLVYWAVAEYMKRI